MGLIEDRASISEELHMIGVALISGYTLKRLIGDSSIGLTCRPLKKAFNFLDRAMDAGDSLEEALSNSACNGLPVFARAVLGSRLLDQEKGEMLRAKYHKIDYRSELVSGNSPYLVVEFTFILLFFLLMLMFVFPQFKEIFMGLRVELPWMTQFVLGMSDFVISNWWMLVLIATIIALTVLAVYPFFTSGAVTAEIMVVLRLLGNIERHRIPNVLEILIHPVILPYTHLYFKEIRVALSEKTDIDACLKPLKLDSMTRWIFRLALQGKGAVTLFEQTAALLEIKAREKKLRLIILGENIMVVGIGTFVAISSAGFFLCMIKLVIAAL